MRPVFNRTPVVIVQHPRERFHPFGTATLAALALDRVALHVAGPKQAPDHGRVQFETGDVLLYPDPDAPRIDELKVHPRRLVVVDGTWAHARRMVLDDESLRSLPRVRLDPSAPSRYRIRREPAAECLSTLESIVVALRTLEPETVGFENLLDAFDKMIDQQLAIAAARRTSSGGGRRRLRTRASRALPDALERMPLRCVVVYGESAAPARDESARRQRRPVYFTAVRVASGECFECVIRDGRRPSDWHLSHMGLDAALLERGVLLEEARQEWLRFVGDGVVVAWNRSSLDLACALGSPDGIFLKGVYCNVTRQPTRSLGEIVKMHGLTSEPLPFLGRARERVQQCLAIARWLHRERTGADAAAKHARHAEPGRAPARNA